MSARLDKVKLVKGFKWERQDPPENQGESSYELVKDAIREGKNELARDLMDYIYYWEIKFALDADIDMVGGFPQFVMNNYGEEGLYQVYREVLIRNRGLTQWPIPPVGKHTETPFDYAMQHALWMVRYHRMGRDDGVGGFVLEEYDDRWEVIWDPCYTGGRTRRGDPNTSMPAHTQAPFNYTTNKVPHNWTWGKTGVTGYCIHCTLLHELLDTEQTGGYLGQWVSGYPENPWDPCRYIAYKNLDWIPEKYYTRLGLKKPPVTSKEPPPQNPKLIKVTHSHDLGPFWRVTDPEQWLNMLVRWRRAMDAGDKDKAIHLTDLLNAENTIHSATYPITWNWRWIDIVVERYGYSELYHCLRSLYSRMEPPLRPEDPVPTKESIPPAEARLRKAAMWARGTMSGPDHDATVKISEEPERFVMELCPCGTGGKALMNITELDENIIAAGKELILPESRWGIRKPMVEPPYSFKYTTQRHPVAWNKLGVPHICTRCCVHFEMDAIARSAGYLATVIERPENHTDPNCKWYFYKDLDKIPEEFYTRIGAAKPAGEKKVW